MALTDPQSLTVGTTQSLPRVLTGVQEATYQVADGTLNMRISHQVTRTNKNSLIAITRKKVTTDPLTDIKTEISATLNLSIRRPLVGFTEAELLELFTGANTWGSASTNANYKSVLGLQS